MEFLDLRTTVSKYHFCPWLVLSPTFSVFDNTYLVNVLSLDLTVVKIQFVRRAVVSQQSTNLEGEIESKTLFLKGLQVKDMSNTF